MESDQFSTIVIERSNLLMGGIEVILYQILKQYTDAGAEIFWIASHKIDIYDGFRDVINDKNITFVSSSKAAVAIKRTADSKKKRVLLLSFNWYEYSHMLALEQKLRHQTKADVSNYLIIPHFKGSSIFIEEAFPAFIRNAIKSTISIAYQTLLENNRLLFCAQAQADALLSHYALCTPANGIQLIPGKRETIDINDATIESRFDSNTILSVSRFEFPHKGYLLGLVDVYAELRKNYPKLKLQIIGDGIDRNRLTSKISEYNAEIRSGIELVGYVPPNELSTYFNRAKVFIGVAGAFSGAVANGLVSICARHYCENCEVYGIYPENSGNSLSETPGIPAYPVIERVICMDSNQYRIESKNTQHAYEAAVRSRTSKKSSFEELRVIPNLNDAQMNKVSPARFYSMCERLLARISILVHYPTTGRQLIIKYLKRR